MTDITSRLENVTPLKAQTWMAHRAVNRKISDARVAELRAMYDRGEFTAEESVISFNQAGELVDGQHRLEMLIGADVAMRFRIQRGVGDAFFAHCDNVKVRSLGDMLHMRDEINVTTLAGCIRQAWAYDHCGVFYPNGVQRARAGYPSMVVYLEYLDRLPELRVSVSSLKTLSKGLAGMCSPSFAAASHHLFSRVDGDLSMDFWKVVSGGAGIEGDTDPRLKLRNRMIKSLRSRSEKMPSQYTAALTVKAWNFWTLGQDTQNLVWNPAKGEAFPQIAGLESDGE